MPNDLLPFTRTPAIVKGNKSLNLVWFKWGSQLWGILKHFSQSRCILISHWSREKKQSAIIIQMEGANWFGWNDLFSSLFPDNCWCPCYQISMILSRFRWQPHGVKSLLPVEFAPEIVLELNAQDSFKMFRASLCLVTCIFEIGCNSRRQIFLLWNCGVQSFIKLGLSCTVHNLREEK